jgi:hypothetical protein
MCGCYGKAQDLKYCSNCTEKVGTVEAFKSRIAYLEGIVSTLKTNALSIQSIAENMRSTGERSAPGQS